MRLGKEFVNNLIISITDGRNIGQVKDLYLDPNLKHLVGLYLGKEGFLNRKAKLIQQDDVQLLGIDAILTKQADVIIDDESLATVNTWQLWGNVVGRAVEAEDGLKIGAVEDIFIDADTTEILGFKLNKIQIEGRIATEEAVSAKAMVSAGDKDNPLVIDIAKAKKLYVKQ